MEDMFKDRTTPSTADITLGLVSDIRALLVVIALLLSVIVYRII